MNRYMIERDLPGVGGLCPEELKAAAAKSNDALAQLSGRAQWLESFVAGNKTFCVYLAKDEDTVREHAWISGFPATKVTRIERLIDPSTAG
jgi:hypothetical protein